MHCVDLPTLQLGARGVAIDFLLRQRGPGGTWEAVDVSNAEVPDTCAMFKRPSTGELVRVALAVVDGPAGRLRYVTHEGFLTPAGEWQAQAFVLFPGTPSKWVPSEVVVFRVAANIRAMAFLEVDPVEVVATAGSAEPDPLESPVLVPDPEVLT